MGEIEIDSRGNDAQHDEKDRQDNEEPFDMPSLFSQPHRYNVREKKLPVNRKHGSSLETFLRIPLTLGQVEAEAKAERDWRIENEEGRRKRIEVRGGRMEAEDEMSNAKVQMSNDKYQIICWLYWFYWLEMECSKLKIQITNDR